MKRILRVVGIVAVLLLVIAAALPFLIDANQFRPRLESELSKSLGREVKVGNLKLSILSGGVSADDLSIADDPAFGRSPFLKAKSLSIGVEMWPLILSRKLHVTGVAIDQPQIELLHFSHGTVMPFTLSAVVAGGGNVKLTGKAGPLNLDDVVLTPVNASLKVTGLDLAGSGLMEAASGIAGLVAVDGAADSNGQN